MPYQVGTPPDTIRQGNLLHTASHKAGLSVCHKNPALFLEKAPSPAFPPKHSPASPLSSPRATRGRTGARPGPAHAAWSDWPRSAPAAPNQLVPTGGAVPPPEAPNSLYSRRQGPSSRNFACTTSAAPTSVPARGRTRAPPPQAKAGLGSASRGRTQLLVSASKTAPGPGAAGPPSPPPLPRPPHLPATTRSCKLLRLAPPAVSTAAEESLRAGSAERRWRRRPQSWRRREGGLEPGEAPALPASRRRPASSPGRQLPQ